MFSEKVTMVLFNCLASYLIADFGDQINWALCPESENCICRKNLTQKGNFMVKCLTLEEQREWCPQVRHLHLLCKEREREREREEGKGKRKILIN